MSVNILSFRVLIFIYKLIIVSIISVPLKCLGILFFFPVCDNDVGSKMFKLTGLILLKWCSFASFCCANIIDRLEFLILLPLFGVVSCFWL